MTIIASRNYSIPDCSSNKELKTAYPKLNDLGSVYTHYDKKTGKNIPTENKIK